MKSFIKVLLFTFLFIFYGCVSISFLPKDESIKYSPTDSVEVYWEEPQESYFIIGKIIVESEDYGEEELFKRLKQKAMEVGAYAIIMTGSNQQSSVYGTPMNGGTLILSGTRRRLEAFAIRFENKEIRNQPQ